MARIVSLLPSATEIICALGARDELVGISHECDHPPDVLGLPVLTKARLEQSPRSLRIDRSVRNLLRQALSIYDLDVDLLSELAPDVIVTQDLCDVCAVSYEQVRGALTRLARREVRVLDLHPRRYDDILDDIGRTARGLGRDGEGVALLRRLRERAAGVAERSARTDRRPTVVALEWIEPLMLAGSWMPDLIELAGGRGLGVGPGESAPYPDPKALEEWDPDVVLVLPCGFTIERTLQEIGALPRLLPWRRWRAVREGRVYVLDGNAYFNRPGPRIVDSLEILASCLHPDLFEDFAPLRAAAVRRVSADLAVEPCR